MSIFKRTQRKYVKKGYRVRNWREYEAGLRDRGSLTVWMSLTDGKLPNWDAPRPMRRKFGNQQVEALVKCRVLNRMASLGMPRSERIQLG